MLYEPLFIKAYKAMLQCYRHKNVSQAYIATYFHQQYYANSQQKNTQTVAQNEAMRLSHQYFWHSKLNMLPENIAIKIFSIIVMLGHKKAIIILQKSLRLHQPNITIDGIIGTQTINAIKAAPEKAIIQHITHMGHQQYCLNV